MADPLLPATYVVMLRARGATDFQRLGPVALGTPPLRGATIEFARDGQIRRGTVDEIFVPPGCEENCVGTVFLTEA